MQTGPFHRDQALHTSTPLYPDLNATQLSSLLIQQALLYFKVFV